MKMRIEISRDKTVTTLRVYGDLEFEALIEFVDGNYRDWLEDDVIWDLNNANMGLLTPDTIGSIFDTTIDLAKIRVGKRAAVVSSIPQHEGMISYIKSLSEIRKFPVKIMGFENVVDAHKWFASERS